MPRHGTAGLVELSGLPQPFRRSRRSQPLSLHPADVRLQDAADQRDVQPRHGLRRLPTGDGADLRSVAMDGDDILIGTSAGDFRFDHLLLGTGYRVDPPAPTGAFQPDRLVATWADRFVPNEARTTAICSPTPISARPSNFRKRRRARCRCSPTSTSSTTPRFRAWAGLQRHYRPEIRCAETGFRHLAAASSRPMPSISTARSTATTRSISSRNIAATGWPEGWLRLGDGRVWRAAR